MIEKRQFYIDGAWVDPVAARDHHVIDPSTEEACAVISLGGTADTDAAVAAARAALPGWMATPPADRIALLEKLADLYKARAADMAQAISLEMGAPIDMAKSSQWGAGYGHLKTFIKTARDFAFVRPLGDHAPTDRIVYEAVGVAALITPWNWPMNQITLKVGAAVVAGCTMILKPSEESPLSAHALCRIDARGRVSARRLQPGQRRWRGRGHRSVGACGRRHGQLHRLDPCRHRDLEDRCGHAQEGASGTGRQGREPASSPMPTTRPSGAACCT